MTEDKPPKPIPVDLLSDALLDLRAARGNRHAEKASALRYFKGGIARGYEVGPLLQRLCFWPNDRESVFWQARLDSKFLDMLKKLSLRELGLAAEEGVEGDSGPADAM
jgi:hypothetical protein